MSIWASYFPKWLNQDLSITKIPPAITGVLGDTENEGASVKCGNQEPLFCLQVASCRVAEAGGLASSQGPQNYSHGLSPLCPYRKV